MLHLSQKEFNLFQKLLIEESGIYFNYTMNSSLTLTLWHCLKRTGIKSYQEYYDFLKNNPSRKEEMQELITELTVGETCFFRNKPQFDALADVILPEIMNKKIPANRLSLRIWSAGCSKGDEPYSIAIAIMETIPQYARWDIYIIGTDINTSALEKARQGIYTLNDIRNVPAPLMHKYFTKKGSSYILNEKVKRMVTFQRHNLANDPFTLDEIRGIDLIFCRNVTVYFNLSTTKSVIEKFYACMNDDGCLFLGHAETLWYITNKFMTIDFPQTFIYKKRPQPIAKEKEKPPIELPAIDINRIPLNETLFAESLKNQKEAQGRTARIKSLYENAIKFFQDKQYDQAALLLNQIHKEDSTFIPAYFAKAVILANQGSYQQAAEELRGIITADNLYIEAYYLLGVLAYKTGDLKEAKAQFRKVLYIDPETALTYYNLSNIYICEKDMDKAVRELKNAIKILEKCPKEEPIKFCEDFTVDFLLRACNNTLQGIKDNKTAAS